ASRPDVVLTDWVMPRMDGVTLCRLLKGHEELRSTYVIILSTRGETAAKVTGLDVGADDYLVTPVETNELLARVRAPLRPRRAPRRPRGAHRRGGVRGPPPAHRARAGGARGGADPPRPGGDPRRPHAPGAAHRLDRGRHVPGRGRRGRRRLRKGGGRRPLPRE